ncbi:hypothetical protein IAL14_004319 [Salmonella enterica]|nr:hypothetical protein [Salmonella enterica]
MNQFYVHVRLFEATAEQTKKFEELMLYFHYRKTTKDDDGDCRLIPDGYILNSTMNCNNIVNQTSSIANSVGVNANIFVCKFEQSAFLLPSAALVGNDFVYRDPTPEPFKLDS